jgi:hypothetical protein
MGPMFMTPMGPMMAPMTNPMMAPMANPWNFWPKGAGKEWWGSGWPAAEGVVVKQEHIKQEGVAKQEHSKQEGVVKQEHIKQVVVKQEHIKQVVVKQEQESELLGAKPKRMPKNWQAVADNDDVLEVAKSPVDTMQIYDSDEEDEHTDGIAINIITNILMSPHTHIYIYIYITIYIYIYI